MRFVPKRSRLNAFSHIGGAGEDQASPAADFIKTG